MNLRNVQHGVFAWNEYSKDSADTTALIAPDTDSSSGGFQGTAFTGNFDGAGFVISNLTIDAAHNDYLGLFGKIEGSNAEIENLGR